MGRSPEKSNPCISCKVRCNVKCYVPLYWFGNFRMCNIFIKTEKVKKKKKKLPAFCATEHDSPIAPSCGKTYYYTIQGLCGPSTPTPNILVALNL